jgi:phosphoglycerate dehydrogenase-like enzyme
VPTLPFSPTRIVIGAESHAAIAAYIRERRPDLALRSAVAGEVTAADMEWGEAFIGFRRPSRAPLGNIQWVHCTGAGVDAWLYPDEIDRGILLTRTSESFGPMIAEWVVARMLAFSQELPALAAAQSERRWAPRDIPLLAGTRALVVGFGDIGRSIAHFLQVFDVQVSAVTRSGQTDSPLLRDVHAIDALPQLVNDIRWLIVTLPLTRETHHLIDRALLSRCEGTILINTGRGAVIEESAIPEALSSGWLAGAALDVFETEPLPPSSPLWQDPRVIISPHISGRTTVAGAAEGFLECLTALERGVLPRWAVDRDRGY